MPTLACSYCGTTITVQPSELRKRNNHFCNQDCYTAWQSRKITVSCTYCGAALLRNPYRVKIQEHHFCNKACRDAWANAPARPLSQPVVTVRCANCNAPLERKAWQVKTYHNHFCNKECHGQWRTRNMRGDNAARTSPRISVPCAECGKLVKRTPYLLEKRPRHFCSKTCSSLWKSKNKSGENAPNWQGGAFEFYGSNWNEQRRRARKRDRYKCQRCGKTQKQNKRALDVHHIQPFRSFNYIPGVNENYLQANQLHNLICLCRTCHGLVERGGASIQPRLPLLL